MANSRSRKTVSKSSAKLPVMFRVSKTGKGRSDYLVVFPSLPGTNNVNTMSCFAPGEGHSSCVAEYVTQKTRPAKPSEVAEMRKYLRVYGYKDLVTVHRMTAEHRKQRAANLLFKS